MNPVWLAASVAARSVILLAVLTVVATVGNLAYGEDQPEAALPKEGYWVLYQFELTGTQIEEPIKGHVTLSFLGSTIENEEKCRWIELREVITDGNDQGEYLVKVLIPESALLTKEFPGQHGIRSWSRTPFAGLRSSTKPVGGTLQKLLCGMPGPRSSLKADDKNRRDVEYQRGLLKDSVAHLGTWTDRSLSVRIRKWAQFTKFTVWLQPELPTRIAEGRFEISEFHDDRLIGACVHTFQVQDTGTDAKSALPDSN